MRIKNISVSNLFGTFNHVVPLNKENRITIIHGKNGFGKTALLRLINRIFNLRYSELRAIPFNDLQIEFDNNSTVKVSKSLTKGGKRKKSDTQLVFDFINYDGVKEKSFSLEGSENNKSNISFSSLSMIDELIPELDRVSPTSWIYLPTNEELSIEDVLERFEGRLNRYLPGEVIVNKHPEWLEDIRNSIHVRFIESQRLLNLSSSSRSRQYTRRTSMSPSVATYANELAEDIQAKLAEYGTLAQSLDRTFPVRVVQRKVSSKLTDEKLRKKLDELEQKRYQLIDAGLLDKDEDPNFQVKEQIDESTKKLLSVYVEDIENKLSVFKELAKKIDLLKRILNKKFSYKQIIINKEKGFIFTTYDGNYLSPTDLSSGEQHELVLLYELLFKVEPNSLILIDEPELSLHVEWQVEFLKDLQDITKLADIDVLIATHSPDIIHDRWDLTVQLEGPTK